MSNFEFDCPVCGGSVAVTATAASMVVICPQCEKPIFLPVTDLPVAKTPSQSPATLSPLATDVVPAPKSQPEVLRCPNCGLSDVANVPMVYYAGGTSHMTSQRTSRRININPGEGFIHMLGVQFADRPFQKEVARFAPPAEKSELRKGLDLPYAMGKFVTFFTVGFVFAGGLDPASNHTATKWGILLGCGAVGAFAVYYRLNIENIRSRNAAIAENNALRIRQWKESWLCLRCDRIWLPGA